MKALWKKSSFYLFNITGCLKLLKKNFCYLKTKMSVDIAVFQFEVETIQAYFTVITAMMQSIQSGCIHGNHKVSAVCKFATSSTFLRV